MLAKAPAKRGQSFDLTKAQKSAYWAVVTDCLTQFFGLTKGTALVKARDKRRSLEDISVSAGEGTSNAYYCHEEPLYMAVRIAGRTIKETPAIRKQYARILQRHLIATASKGCPLG